MIQLLRCNSQDIRAKLVIVVCSVSVVRLCTLTKTIDGSFSVCRLGRQGRMKSKRKILFGPIRQTVIYKLVYYETV